MISKRKEKYTDKKGEKEVKSRVKITRKNKPKIALKLR